MKRKVVIVFLMLMLAISTRGIAYDQASAAGNCETVAECLQSAVEKNIKLEKENLELKKDIGELQNNLKEEVKKLRDNLEDKIRELRDKLKNTEWVDVPNEDHEDFNVMCEYRIISQELDGKLLVSYPIYLYPKHIEFHHCCGVQLSIQPGTDRYTFSGRKNGRLQKRCSVEIEKNKMCTSPRGQL